MSMIGKGGVIGASKPERASIVMTRAVGSSVVFLFNREVKVKENVIADESLSFDLMEYADVLQDSPMEVRVDFGRPVLKNLSYEITQQPNWCETPLLTPVSGMVS